ncbi:hypothetical protein BJX61DRAFT_537879 [Aspergillus egyptiacus]|nr:hypothetical protein BJX61DRAFT_537879 [Aspergillus egyptiacus]
MVGVPRSKGCQTCLQRRVKCDQTHPECLQCSRRLVKCPGYEKRWKFYNKTSASSRKASKARSRTQAIPPLPSTGAKLQPCTNETMDERVEPNLAIRAIDLQGKEAFCSFLLASFPAQFASCGGRVDVNWVQYARQQPTLHVPQALTWAFRSLATLHVGRTHQDPDKVISSRHMYSRALNYLSTLITHPRYARAAETLATAILLNIYEMQDGLSPLSWLTHAQGLSTLIQLRGPEAHRTGFGTTLLKSCRSILVSEAFVRGGRCFLDRPEWQSLMAEVVEAESRSSKGSQLGILVDRAFIEVARCPRWVVETRALLLDQELLDTAPLGSLSANGLMHTMARSRRKLAEIQQLLEIGLSRQGMSDSVAAWETFIGPIALNFVGTFAQSALNGMRLAIALLDQLIELVRAHVAGADYEENVSVSSSTESMGSFMVNPWAKLGSEKGGWQLDFEPDYGLGLFYMTRETSGWMDRMVMSMGLLGLRPRELL